MLILPSSRRVSLEPSRITTRSRPTAGTFLTDEVAKGRSKPTQVSQKPERFCSKKRAEDSETR